ncbi:MAG: hypothetical protein RBR71_14190, partial [Gudongella sp.]|nr:hypothetical protein [Gudongella sp.]
DLSMIFYPLLRLDLFHAFPPGCVSIIDILRKGESDSNWKLYPGYEEIIPNIITLNCNVCNNCYYVENS